MHECLTCDHQFFYRDECDHHMTQCGHWIECETCSRVFRSHSACRQHMNTLDHWAPVFPCQSCDREFRSENASIQHMNAVGHWKPRFQCQKCPEKFHNPGAAEKHMDMLNHYRNYCKPCDRHFQNESNLRAHLNSKTHRGTTAACPFCKGSFVTASGVFHHLEQGSCPNAPSMNHDTILRMVRQSDTHGIITNKQIEWHKEQQGQYSATNRAYNGQAWECYLCHREFNSPNSLNQHANSPVHQQKGYHCPNKRANCVKQFVSLAGLFNHFESESCGFIRFERVQRVQQQLAGTIMGRRLLIASSFGHG
ncbi:uncharacterized protein N7511_009028 [Penicillium nucicola]|uniref:uncharacterized protein n=1 Tax=Penicillium nucicola TaxID=1850975 RepID=UPI002545A594|nr:uncharacterized protein N7511_009028 [Penicillium nucicola]KAJ5747332.1 hypothetical protein N7511_009028 [Penicillium nucicola]